MRKFYLLLVLGFMSSVGLAQYDKSVGLRLGSSSGVTFKKFVHAEEAVELLLSGRNDGLQVTGLYQFHKPTDWNISDRIYLNYGVGGHFGYEKRNQFSVFIDPFNIPPPNSFNTEIGIRNRHQFAMGIDAIIGLEYRWLSVPMTIGLDLKPYFDFIGMRTTRLRFWDSALSFKYIF